MGELSAGELSVGELSLGELSCNQINHSKWSTGNIEKIMGISIYMYIHISIFSITLTRDGIRPLFPCMSYEATKRVKLSLHFPLFFYPLGKNLWFYDHSPPPPFKFFHTPHSPPPLLYPLKQKSMILWAFSTSSPQILPYCSSSSPPPLKFFYSPPLLLPLSKNIWLYEHSFLSPVKFFHTPLHYPLLLPFSINLWLLREYIILWSFPSFSHQIPPYSPFATPSTSPSSPPPRHKFMIAARI